MVTRLDVTRLRVLPAIEAHLRQVSACRRCPDMIGPVVTPRPVAAKVYLCGQAPGAKEGIFGRPFAWTAGKQLFRWFHDLGVDEETFRARAFLGAVCRCFPGKTAAGGDRVPDAAEVDNCSGWMAREIELLRPDLIVAVGRLAIERFVPELDSLADVVGRTVRATAFGHTCDVIPLPHPSGASTWFKVEPGRTLLQKALRRLGRHPAWRTLRDQRKPAASHSSHEVSWRP
jgi:uracil-DNA glycosylase